MKTDWVNCPICDAPDMRQTTDDDGYKLIHCVNHACKSNGGDYDSTKTEDNDIMPMIDGKSFRCSCGCNVFRRLKYNKNKYKCNSCEVIYIGE